MLSFVSSRKGLHRLWEEKVKAGLIETKKRQLLLLNRGLLRQPNKYFGRSIGFKKF